MRGIYLSRSRLPVSWPPTPLLLLQLPNSAEDPWKTREGRSWGRQISKARWPLACCSVWTLYTWARRANLSALPPSYPSSLKARFCPSNSQNCPQTGLLTARCGLARYDLTRVQSQNGWFQQAPPILRALMSQWKAKGTLEF